MFPGGDLTIVLNGALSGSTSAFELVFPVESVAAVRKQLTDRGCHFTGEPREVAKGMWAATLTDPDGHRLALFGARLSSGSANRPYATLSVNDASVRVTSGKPAMVQSPQRRLYVQVERNNLGCPEPAKAQASRLSFRIRSRESACPVPWQRAPDQNIPSGTRSCRPQHAGRPHIPGDTHGP